MSRQVLFTLLFILCAALTPAGNEIYNTAIPESKAFPFDHLKYEKVVAYDFKGHGEHALVVDGKFNPYHLEIYKQMELNAAKLKELRSTLIDTSTYGGVTAACFEPHFALVFYQGSKVVGHINVCMQCNYLISSHTIPAVNSHANPICNACYFHGFSKIGRKKISAYIRDLGFDHWQLKSGLFDE